MSGARRIRLVRHGRAAAGWDADADPDLDELGTEQARAVADRLAREGVAAIVSSPLLRCRSTASHTAAAAGRPVSIEPAVAEIPSPEAVEMAARTAWLRSAMVGEWADLGPRYTSFRDGVVAAVSAMADGTVVFSHFVAINAVIGACSGDERLVIRSLDNCSVTVVDVDDDGNFTLVEGGHEADTLVR